jgi:F-type H+-transporting ATPase subunit delta
MAELATIARPYAEALFKACAASSGADLAATASWLDELALIADNSQVRQLADNPKVTADQVFDLFVGVARSALPDMARNFLRTVIELEKRFGRKLNLSVQLDPSLIGGVRVVVGDEVLDTSVKARLEQMKAALTA